MFSFPLMTFVILDKLISEVFGIIQGITSMHEPLGKHEFDHGLFSLRIYKTTTHNPQSGRD